MSARPVAKRYYLLPRAEGRVASHCPDCGKRCYGSRRDARRAMVRVHNRISVYFCEACHFWHVADAEKHGRRP